MTDQVELSKAKYAGIVSILIIIFGFIDCVIGFVYIGYGAKDGSGLWSGGLLLVTGICGIITWVKRAKIAMVFFLIGCILGVIVACVQAILGVIGFIFWKMVRAIIETDCTVIAGQCRCRDQSLNLNLQDCSWINTIEIIFISFMIINGLCAVVVFAGSIIGCLGTCCANRPAQAGVVVVQQPGMVVQYPPQGGYPPPGYPAQQPVGAGGYPMAQIPPKQDQAQY